MIKRYCWLFSLLLCAAVVCPAQSYDKMWKEVKVASAQDRPETALAALEKIRKRAVRENNAGQLMSATFSAAWLKGNVSPDSTKAALNAMERMISSESIPASRALWQAAMGKTLLLGHDTAEVRRGRALMDEALQNMSVLSVARTTDYLPVFVVGDDSRYYKDDLLSVVIAAAAESPHFSDAENLRFYGRAIVAYRRQNNMNAVLLATLDSIRTAAGDYTPKGIGALQAGLLRAAETFERLPLNIETYIALVQLDVVDGAKGEEAYGMKMGWAEKGLKLYGKEKRSALLKNFIARLQQPYINMEAECATVYPGKTFTAKLTARNVTQAALRIYRLEADAVDVALAEAQGIDIKKKSRKQLVQTFVHDFAAAPAYRSQTDTLCLQLSEPGIYLCDLQADGRSLCQSLVNVSRLLPLMQSLPNGTNRIRLLDAATGAPVKNGAVHVYKKEYGKLLQQAVYESAPNGEIVIPRSDKQSYGYDFFAVTATDRYLPGFSVDFTSAMPRLATVEKTVTKLQLFTDRAIYRPGQTVYYSGVAYTQQGDSVSVVSGMETTVKLSDGNGQSVGEQICKTDSFGTISGKFRLPDVCLPGAFRLSAAQAYPLSVKVEEYKRPTFMVETDDIETAYQPGDTVLLNGTVKTYTEIPLPGSRIKYSITKWAAYRYGTDRDSQPQSGVTTADSTGHFQIPVVLDRAGNAMPGNMANRMRYTVSIAVTADNGETVSAEHVIPVANRASWLSTDWPRSLCKERPGRVTISRTTASGKELGGSVSYILSNGTNKAVSQGEWNCGQAFTPHLLEALPSGEYNLLLVAGNDTLLHKFLLFSELDTKPAGKETFWQYVRTNARQDSALVIVGSPRDSVTLFYTLVSGNKRMADRVITFSDSLLHFPLVYEPEMGDGACATFAFVKNGTLYTTEARITKPMPEKRLLLNWQTFRSRLVSGQTETWQLRITTPDGTPADAVLMARLYDASLDAFAASPWDFNIFFNRRQISARLSIPYNFPLSLVGIKAGKELKEPTLDFTQWNGSIFKSRYYGILEGRLYGMAIKSEAALSDRMFSMSGNSLSGLHTAAKHRNQVVADSVAPEMAQDTGSGTAAADVVPRTNFAETAFFQPALRTSADGVVTLRFTLPESLTSWNFTALAHSRAMDYGRLDTTIVARKDFMVQPAMPRFVRRGDKAVIPVAIRNLSDNSIDGTVHCLIIDPENQKVLKNMTRRFAVAAAAGTTATFDLSADFAQPVLICRVVAQTEGFSDGEEHYLPVLTDRVDVTRSAQFVMTEPGSLNLRTDTLWSDQNRAENRRLNIEMSSNPMWYAVASLPALAAQSGESALGWAARYYAVSLAGRIAADNPEIRQLATASDNSVWASVLFRNPELKQTLLAETPWVAAARSEAERPAALRDLFNAQSIAANKYSALDHLKALQQPDGSWSWYKGMPGNAYITSQIALLLARLQNLSGDESAQTCLTSAMRFMEQQADKDAADMKASGAPRISEAHLIYLYTRALLGLKPNATVKYLTEQACEKPTALSMYEKSLLAVALTKTGAGDRANEVLGSLLEHTVSAPGRGRYFDTERAVSTLRDYRIPTQVATIEALMTRGSKADLSAADEMRLWLMLSKRTQLWQNSPTTVDAVYALLQGARTNGAVMSLKDSATVSRPLYFTLHAGEKILAVNADAQAHGRNTAGYVNETFTDAKTLAATDITIRKQEPGTAWGSVVACYTLPVSAVKVSSEGLGLTRRFEVKRNGKWQPLQEGGAISTGDVVRQVFVVTADGDYDFISLKSARPANLEPRRPLSGYTWENGLGLYRSVRDASTEYFMEKLPKGIYTLTEEYVADRAGRYQCGTSKIQSLYAPEFGAQTPGFVVFGQ